MAAAVPGLGRYTASEAAAAAERGRSALGDHVTDSLEDAIRAAWAQIRDRFQRDAADRGSASLVRAWSDSVRQLRASFAAYVRTAVIADRFSIPEDYALFMRILGGGWNYDGGWGRLYGAQEVVRATAQSCENGAEDRREDDGLWLDIGCWGSKHAYLLCCDRRHRLFGVVVEGEDAHPWGSGFRAMWVLAPTFLGFLRDYLPGRTRRPSKLAPPLPASTWLDILERRDDT
jgi:hypothetical protein